MWFVAIACPAPSTPSHLRGHRLGVAQSSQKNHGVSSSSVLSSSSKSSASSHSLWTDQHDVSKLEKFKSLIEAPNLSLGITLWVSVGRSDKSSVTRFGLLGIDHLVTAQTVPDLTYLTEWFCYRKRIWLLGILWGNYGVLILGHLGALLQYWISYIPPVESLFITFTSSLCFQLLAFFGKSHSLLVGNFG